MKTSFGHLAEILKIYRKELRWVIFFSFVSNILMLTPSIYMMQIYDRILVSRNQLSLIAVTAIMLLLILFMSFSEFVRSRLLVRLGVRFDNMIGPLVFNRSFKDYLENPNLEPSKAISSLANLRLFLTGSGILALLDAPWIPIYTAVGFLLHPALGCLIILCCLIQIILAYQGHKALSVISQDHLDQTEQNNTYLFNKIRNADSVEAMGMRRNLMLAWLNIHNALIKKATNLAEKQSKIEGINKASRQIMQSSSLAIGALLVIKGGLSVGSMIAANLLIARALAPLDALVGSYKQFMQAIEAYSLLEGKLDSITHGGAQTKHFQMPLGKITIQNLTINPKTSAKPILNNINLEIQSGKCYAIIGHSGSGKSTLMTSMLGLWPDALKKVNLDDVLLEDWDRELLGSHIGYLPQDIQLFEGSVAENIARFGEVEPSKVISATKITGLHETILRLPEGYDTQLDEFSSLLSGGQRQRLGLARAVYGSPSLIFLDEPNANLDDQGERALVECLAQLKKESKTIIFIAHRGSVIGLADQVIEMKQGELVMSSSLEDFSKRHSVRDIN